MGWIVVGHVADIGEARDLGRGVDPCAPGERRRGSPPRHGSAPFDDEIDQRFDVAIRVVEKMGGVGEAAAAVTRCEPHRVGAEYDLDRAGCHVNMQTAAASPTAIRIGTDRTDACHDG